jgi:hypothetical protein
MDNQVLPNNASLKLRFVIVWGLAIVLSVIIVHLGGHKDIRTNVTILGIDIALAALLWSIARHSGFAKFMATMSTFATFMRAIVCLALLTQ